MIKFVFNKNFKIILVCTVVVIIIILLKSYALSIMTVLLF